MELWEHCKRVGELLGYSIVYDYDKGGPDGEYRVMYLKCPQGSNWLGRFSLSADALWKAAIDDGVFAEWLDQVEIRLIK